METKTRAIEGIPVSTPVLQDAHDDALLTAREVAEILSVPQSWVYSAVRGRHGNGLPHVRVGRYVRFELKAVQEFIARQKRGYRPETGSAIMGPRERRESQ